MKVYPMWEFPYRVLLHIGQLLDGMWGLATLGLGRSQFGLNAARYLCGKRLARRTP